eukprot:gene2858-2494_t
MAIGPVQTHAAQSLPRAARVEAGAPCSGMGCCQSQTGARQGADPLLDSDDDTLSPGDTFDAERERTDAALRVQHRRSTLSEERACSAAAT